jgi:cell division protein FtsZ
MSLKLQLPKLVDVKPRLTVIGVGGAGCNAVNNMIAAGLQGVDFVVANTDAQSLAASSAEHRIQLGANLTEGLGAGSKPEIGEAAAEEAIEEIRAHVVGSHMVFIAAGMGGGTGTGAAAVIARAARELGILTVGIVTKPFLFEGARRLRISESGVQSLRQHVDTLIVIPNQNLFRIANERTTFAEAFVLADQVLYSGVACIVDLVLKEGLINLDFADVRTVMSGMGTAMMGTGEASGDRRAILAAEEAIANPLLDDVSLKGARGLLLSITGGPDLTLYEVDEAASRVREEVDPECNIIVGATFDPNLGDRVRVSIVASGMKRAGEPAWPVAAPHQAPVMQAQHMQPQIPGMARGSTATVPHMQPQMPPMQSPPSFIPQTGAQAASMQRSGPMGADDEIQRRLSEVLQQSQAPYQPAYQPPQQIAPSQMPPPHAQQHYGVQGQARESWQAPGNVTIEEGYSPFGQPQRGAMTQSRSAPQQSAAMPSQGFEPMPPSDIRRTGRRMPDLQEFPEVAQREWQSKRAGAQTDTSKPDVSRDEASRRKGLFSRLTGLGRSKQEPAAGQSYDDENQSPDEVALPIFFGRERR